MGLDPDGPQAAYESLHLAGLLGTECRQAARCMPATEGLPQRSAGEDRTDEGLMEPTLGGSLRGSPGGRLLRSIEPSQVLPGAGIQVTGHSLGERQAPPGRAGRPKQACRGLSPAALSGSREVLASISHLPQGLPGPGWAEPAVRGALPHVSRPLWAMCPTAASPSAPGPETGGLPAGGAEEPSWGPGNPDRTLSPQWTGSPSSETWSTSA